MNSNEIDDGGPAFACASETGHQPGMSLRDWFAGQALAGMWTDGVLTTSVTKTANQGAAGFTNVEEGMAKIAYEQADAMIKERAGP